MIGDSNVETNFPHMLLLTNRHFSRISKTFSNDSLANIKFSKIQLSKMIQLRGFIGRLLWALIKNGLLLIENVIKPLVKSVLIPLKLTAAARGDARINKKMLGSRMTI